MIVASVEILGVQILEVVQCLIGIAILYFVIYTLLHYLRNTRGAVVLFGLFITWLVLSLLAPLFGLEVIAYILTSFGNSLLLTLFILFQPEIRRALAQIGVYALGSQQHPRVIIDELVAAADNLALHKHGALIVIERRMRLQTIIEDSTQLDIKINALILESIFFPNSPLHDGAVIIRDDRIVAAEAILPLTRAKDVSPRLGTRHRAALGISEESDAVALVVSEETGAISIAHRGVPYRDLSPDELKALLEKLLQKHNDGEFSETVQLIEARGNEIDEVGAGDGASSFADDGHGGARR